MDNKKENVERKGKAKGTIRGVLGLPQLTLGPTELGFQEGK